MPSLQVLPSIIYQSSKGIESGIYVASRMTKYMAFPHPARSARGSFSAIRIQSAVASKV